MAARGMSLVGGEELGQFMEILVENIKYTKLTGLDSPM
jgi:hypothetical protein